MNARVLCASLALSGVWAQSLPARADADADCGLEDPRIAREAAAIGPKAGEVAFAELPPPVRRQRPLLASSVEHPSGGALFGKTVYVSPGHGFYSHPELGGWRTQRGNTHDLVEDFISAEAVSYYLVRYLRNMGAYVVSVRELDRSPHRVEVDDGEASLEGAVTVAVETSGWGRLAVPITGDENPFSAGEARVLDAVASQTGAVVWTFDVPEAGEYNVYVGYVQDPSRASDAHYTVRHAGGETHFRVDQRRHGSTWVWLGRFYFEAGSSPERGAVALYDDSSEPGATLSADVARIGGGVGIFDRGVGVLERPMFELCARYHAQLSGAPPSVYDYAGADRQDDVGTRSRFAAWDHAEGEDAVYLAWHTNAPSPARGTSSFAYGPEAFGTLDQFSGVPGSLELMAAVHGELIRDLRSSWKSDWTDRGQRTAYFGEVNPNHNPEMPAVLVEVAFHDTAEDADALRHPAFRRLAARAMAQGIARYFAERDGEELVLPPEPPTAVAMRQGGPGSLILSWAPPAHDPAGGDPPAGYRVYFSQDGRAFDEGRDVAETELIVDLAPDAGPLFARVTAVNAGGESMPTQVVGARASGRGAAQVLLVGGFDRLDARMLFSQDLSAFDIGTIERGFIDRMNHGSYLARWGRAVFAAETSFAAASAAAVRSGAVSLDGYRAVLWQLGEEEEPLSAESRDRLTAYVEGGGSLMVSGSEFARVHGGPSASEADAAFLSGVLGATFVRDDAGSYGIAGPEEGPLAGLGDLDFGDRAAFGYDAELPDLLEPSAGSFAALRYELRAAGAAATFSDRGGGVFVLGFPFEVIEGEETRAETMAHILDAFDVEPDPGLAPEPMGGLGGGCGCRAGLVASPATAGGLLLFAAALLQLARRRRPWKAAARDGDRGERHEG